MPGELLFLAAWGNSDLESEIGGTLYLASDSRVGPAAR
jgi:hypothetical protein